MSEQMKNKHFFPAVVAEIKPETVYQDEVFTQYAFFELSNKNTIGVFDPDKQCLPEMIGKKLRISLWMLTFLIEKDTKRKSDISPEKPPILHVYGKVIEIIPQADPGKEGKFFDAVVDFGVGKVSIFANLEKYEKFDIQIGDFIHAYGRVDLDRIENLL